MPSVVKIVSEQEIPRIRGHVVHRSPQPPQYIIPWEGREQGESVVRTLYGDIEEVDEQDQSKYIMIPPTGDQQGAACWSLGPLTHGVPWRRMVEVPVSWRWFLFDVHRAGCG